LQTALTGEPGQYTIQVSSKLANWVFLTNIILGNAAAQFLDSSAPNQPFRFYRAFVPP